MRMILRSSTCEPSSFTLFFSSNKKKPIEDAHNIAPLVNNVCNHAHYVHIFQPRETTHVCHRVFSTYLLYWRKKWIINPPPHPFISNNQRLCPQKWATSPPKFSTLWDQQFICFEWRFLKGTLPFSLMLQNNPVIMTSAYLFFDTIYTHFVFMKTISGL